VVIYGHVDEFTARARGLVVVVSEFVLMLLRLDECMFLARAESYCCKDFGYCVQGFKVWFLKAQL
jgi:hypothetical protein